MKKHTIKLTSEEVRLLRAGLKVVAYMMRPSFVVTSSFQEKLQQVHDNIQEQTINITDDGNS